MRVPTRARDLTELTDIKMPTTISRRPHPVFYTCMLMKPRDPIDSSDSPGPPTSPRQDHPLHKVLQEAGRLDRACAFADAARLLDDILASGTDAPAPLRFQALVLRADVAVSLDDLIEARGILAEAKQVALTAGDRASLDSDLIRADQLEVFLTHRGCAG